LEKYTDLLYKLQNPAENEDNSDYQIKVTINSIRIIKSENNIGLFENGEVGEITFTSERIFKDSKTGELIGPAKQKETIIFECKLQVFTKVWARCKQ